MARYDAGHKLATRERILDTAAQRLKVDGIDGSGVATLMKDAGLTNGAFYAHFDSKEALVAEVLGRELDTQRATFSTFADGVAGVRQMVTNYLSLAHRDNPGAGCPSAAMLDEVARASEATRDVFSTALLAVIDELVARVSSAPGPATDAQRAQALSAYALMVGTIQLARTVTDEKLSRDVIARGLDNAMTILESAGDAE